MVGAVRSWIMLRTDSILELARVGPDPFKIVVKHVGKTLFSTSDSVPPFGGTKRAMDDWSFLQRHHRAGDVGARARYEGERCKRRGIL